MPCDVMPCGVILILVKISPQNHDWSLCLCSRCIAPHMINRKNVRSPFHRSNPIIGLSSTNCCNLLHSRITFVAIRTPQVIPIYKPP